MGNLTLPRRESRPESFRQNKPRLEGEEQIGAAYTPFPSQNYHNNVNMLPYVSADCFGSDPARWSDFVPVDGVSSTVHVPSDDEDSFTRPSALFHLDDKMDLVDFFRDHNLLELLPVVCMHMKLGGLLIDGVSRVETVDELMLIDLNTIKNFFMRRETYYPAHGKDAPTAPTSLEAIERAIDD